MFIKKYLPTNILNIVFPETDVGAISIKASLSVNPRISLFTATQILIDNFLYHQNSRKHIL